MKHTPLPFRVQLSMGDVCIVGGDDKIIATEPLLKSSDAQFIVTACNAHYDLVEALESILNELAVQGDLSCGTAIEAEQALRKAKEE